MKLKKCSVCKTDKPQADFHKKIASSDGLSSWCKPCKHERDMIRHTSRKSRMTDEERDLYKIKKSARRKVATAVSRGQIHKPSQCERCKKRFALKDIQGHHHDYNKPLDIEWLCRTCHLNEHGGAKTLNCETCKKKFTCQRWQDSRKFCSHACFYAKLRKNKKETSNHETTNLSN